jgi:hypothetical protein
VKTIGVSPFVVVIALTTFLVAQQPSESAVKDCHPGKYEIKGTVTRGRPFSRAFDGFVFTLVPIEYGWMIDISQGTQHYLDGMTGPRHFVPNPIEIEGWHFRIAANTGPNRGDVNAQDETRRFLFSPRWPHCEDTIGLDKDGQGVLDIGDMELGNLAEGEKANITRTEFSVVLTVGPFACTACPTTGHSE